MQVAKVINNNLIKIFDENGKECIAMGKGIGFKKKAGDEIPDSAIEKIYRIADTNAESQFTQLVVDIPLKHLQVANLIIDYANATLNTKLRDNIYVSLTDHINFALERLEKGIILNNKLLYEIKHYYPSEYLVGIEALNIVERELGVKFSEDEAGYIAMHLVESEVDSDQSDYANKSVVLIQAIINIIKYHYRLDLNEDSLEYERLIVHLRYFSDRVINNKPIADHDAAFIETMKKNFLSEYNCCLKIRAYVKDQFHYEISDEEIIYLCVHIHRIVTSR